MAFVSRTCLLVVTFVLFGAILPGAAFGADCTPAQKAEGDRQLWLNQRDKDLSVSQNAPYGAPSPQLPELNDRLLVQRDYVIGYDDELRLPIWTANRIVAGKIGKVGRRDCFRADPRNLLHSATESDYNEPIFDQGHMVPNADLTSSTTSVVNSFVMTNMAPQTCFLNRGVWQILEDLVRHWAAAEGAIYVVSGSILDWNGDGARDPDDVPLRMKSRNGKQRVAVPTAFYKVIAREGVDGNIETLTVLLPHDETDLDGAEAITYLTQHIRVVADIEVLTGLKLFPQFSGTRTEATELWDISTASFRTLVLENCRRTAGKWTVFAAQYGH